METYRKIDKKRATRASAWLVAVAILLLSAEGVFASADCAGSAKNTRISEFLLNLSAAKTAIAEQIQTDPYSPVGAELANQIPTGFSSVCTNGRMQISRRTVSPKGKITAFSPQLGVSVELTPQIEGGMIIAWHCRVDPPENAPPECRSSKPPAQNLKSAR